MPPQPALPPAQPLQGSRAASDILAYPKMAQNTFVNKASEIKTNAIPFHRLLPGNYKPITSELITCS